MPKLTKNDRRTLEQALHHARRANGYIQKPETVLCTKTTQATTTLHLTRGYDDLILYPVAKDIGSDICGLHDAIKIISQFLDADAKK